MARRSATKKGYEIGCHTLAVMQKGTCLPFMLTSGGSATGEFEERANHIGKRPRDGAAERRPSRFCIKRWQALSHISEGDGNDRRQAVHNARALHQVEPRQQCASAHRHQAVRNSLARTGSFQSGRMK